MNDMSMPNAYGSLIEPTTLQIQRLLPGPIERVWAYLTQSELRRQWLAAGAMELKPGAPFELTWRNGELSDPPGQRPPGFGEEHSMKSTIVDVAPPGRLVFTWGEKAEVAFELEPQGNQVMLTVTHRRVTERGVLLNVSAGWHAHLDVLAARLADRKPATPFWDAWSGLKKEYEARIPA